MSRDKLRQTRRGSSARPTDGSARRIQERLLRLQKGSGCRKELPMLARFARNVLVSVNTLLIAAPAAAQYSSITDLGDLGGGASIATSINARGQVAGASLREGATTEGGFIWQDGVMTDLGSLGGTNTVAYAINNRGQVVGGSNRAADA